MWIKLPDADNSPNINQFHYRSSAGYAGWEFDTVDDNWYHYAVTRDVTGTIRIYFDGILMVETGQPSSPGLAGAGATILTADVIESISEAAACVDELVIYADCLSHEQIVYLAKGLAGVISQGISPEYSEFDLSNDGTINLIDFAVISSVWLSE
jgi:hypothetical protein